MKTVRYCDSYVPYRACNIGNQTLVKLMIFFKTTEDAHGQEAENHFMPILIGDVVANCANVTTLITEVGFEPKTLLAESVAHWVPWYRGYNQQ